MKCPYCDAEFNFYTDANPVFVDREYDFDGTCWDEYRCDCPKCGKTFRAFEDYAYIGQSSMKMDE